MPRLPEDGKPVRQERDDFRLRPSRKKARGDRPPHQIAKTLTHLMRAIAGGNANRSARRSDGASPAVRTPYRQRCAVRLTYSANRVPGHFAAHGRYLLRDRAAGAGEVSGSIADTPLADALAKWQGAGDKRIFKVILSPEFGQRIDLTRLSKEFVSRIEHDMGVTLQWAAVNHFNTDHPHVHLVIRGVDDRGAELRFPSQYIKENLRSHAEALCTEQIGVRSLDDVHHAQQAEVRLHRFTSLDKLLLKRAELCQDDASQLRLELPDVGRAAARVSESTELLAARLRFLTDAGIARAESSHRWTIPMELESLLRTMQNVADRQRMLAKTGVAVSDDRLPQRITHSNDVTELRGRVLGHVDNDVTGRVYMVLEGTDGAIHFLPHTATLERQRAEGSLRPGHFVSLERKQTRLLIDDLGDADALLKTQKVFPALPNEIPAVGQGWHGWLGSFHAKLKIPVRPQAPLPLEQVLDAGKDRPDFER